MKVAVIRHGVGREAEVVLTYLQKSIYKDIQNIVDFEFEFFYLFRQINNENSIRSKELNLSSSFSSLPFEKVINIKLPKNFYIDFASYFTKDVHQDNFQSYRNLLNQTFMFRKFAEEIDIKKFSSFIVLRDDVIFLKYGNFKKLLKDSQKGYVTSIWDWEGGVHERFYMCPTFIFEKLISKYETLKNLRLKKEKVNPFYYCSEYLTLKIIKSSKFKIYPHNIKTQRVRKGFLLANEKHRIRFHDPNEVFNIFKSILNSKILEPGLTLIKNIGNLYHTIYNKNYKNIN